MYHHLLFYYYDIIYLSISCTKTVYLLFFTRQMKDIQSLNHSKITSIKFEILTPTQIKDFSTRTITKKEIYDINTKLPTEEGVLDPYLGTVRGTDTCNICNQSITCPGHFGDIELYFPVFHVGFFKHVYNILQCICKTCGCLLLDREKTNKVPLKKIVEDSRKVSRCPSCLEMNYPIKRGPGYKLYHGDNRQDLTPLFVYNLFKCINESDYKVLNIASDPTTLLIKTLPVPPSCIRPSVKMLNTSNEDDLTIKLAEIIYTNDVLRNGIEKGNPLAMIQEDWNYLQLQVSLFINSDLPGYNKAESNLASTRQIRGIIQRLKGKGGRFRGNLSGKRVDFTGRTVISPDPNLSIEEVGIPLQMARTLTIPEIVTEFNMKYLRKCILNGPLKHPGANYYQNGNRKSYLLYANREKLSETLQVGDIVERHLCDGDVVLFNRQPSLHRLSIMAHKVKVHPHKTLRFNECVCTPYNADFDGDEMNIHVPQTLEARAEAYELMRVGVNMLTPRNGEPLIACTQDFITAAYLLTDINIFFSKAKFGQLVSCFSQDYSNIKVSPCIIRPCVMYSGKQVIDVLIKESLRKGRVDGTEKLNMVSKNRSYKAGKTIVPQNDSLVVFKDDNYLFGRLDKSTIGSENKNTSLIYRLICIHNNCAIHALNCLAKLSSVFLSEHGFSIGIDDVTPSSNLLVQKQDIVSAIYKECDAKISDYNKNLLQPLPGCSILETLESQLSSQLSKIREECGSICMKELSPSNSPLIMQDCGSKGSKINVAQMVACVGQQIISGKRISDSFVCDIKAQDNSKSSLYKNGTGSRTLPHFHAQNALTPIAKGFVCNSFYSGLTANELFFHAVSGREGLVDTAVKTAETGYMQRRLMKAMEDLSIGHDGTVRNAHNQIVQFKYSEDASYPKAYSLIEPGCAVGAIAGQSIGEPGTQMTLKTFHFAGVASMNITLGVPRLKEIINASKNISTPLIKAEIDNENYKNYQSMEQDYDSVTEAYTIKGRIEKTYLRDICSSLNEHYGSEELSLEIEIDFATITNLKLELTMDMIKTAISQENKIPIEHIMSRLNKIEIYINKDYYIYNSVKRKILNTKISGIRTVTRCVVNEDKPAEYSLIIEGMGLLQVLGTQGIKTATTNNIMEIAEVLGIEAAREAIINEVLYTMEKHGITIDKRHVDLLADTMTYKGEVLGITRFGIKKMKLSTLMLASFEQTSDHLFDAAMKGKKDLVKGVSESIIIGNHMNIGTGCVDLYFEK